MIAINSLTEAVSLSQKVC